MASKLRLDFVSPVKYETRVSAARASKADVSVRPNLVRMGPTLSRGSFKAPLHTYSRDTDDQAKRQAFCGSAELCRRIYRVSASMFSSGGITASSGGREAGSQGRARC